MKPIVPGFQTDVEVGRTAQSPWQRLFRWGVAYLKITTVAGTIAAAIFGEQKGGMPLWGWVLVGPYLFFMLYCSNYLVIHRVDSRVVKAAWWCLMALIALVLLVAGLRL